MPDRTEQIVHFVGENWTGKSDPTLVGFHIDSTRMGHIASEFRAHPLGDGAVIRIVWAKAGSGLVGDSRRPVFQVALGFR